MSDHGVVELVRGQLASILMPEPLGVQPASVRIKEIASLFCACFMFNQKEDAVFIVCLWEGSVLGLESAGHIGSSSTET